MKRGLIFSNQHGQVSVENILITLIIAGLMIPFVYKYALGPMLDKMQGQRKNLVDFVAQNNKKPVPSSWFASERVAQIKDVKDIDAPKEIEVKEIPEPGEIPNKDIQDPKEIKVKEIKAPKAIPPPKPISVSSNPGQGGAGAGGAGSALGGETQDPNFFGGGEKGGGNDGKNAENSSGMSQQSGSDGKFSDEYAPKNQRRDESQQVGKDQDRGSKDSVDGSLEKNSKKNLLLNEVREEEQARSSPFDWWLIIKLLILGLIIFLVVLIGLSNMKKR